MLGWIVKRRMAAFEKEFEYDMGYARYIYGASPRGFWRFMRIMGLSEHREGVPREPWYTAKLVATLREDCGPCTQREPADPIFERGRKERQRLPHAPKVIRSARPG